MQDLAKFISDHGFTAWINPLGESVSFWIDDSASESHLFTVTTYRDARAILGY